MQPDWMTHPLALYALLAVSLVLTLYLFVSAKAEIRAGARRARQEREALARELAVARTAVDETRAAVMALQDSVAALEEASGALVAPQPARSGLNLTARSQVLRRHRLGEAPTAIAASLGLPQSEVDLLLKVNRIVLENL